MTSTETLTFERSDSVWNSRAVVLIERRRIAADLDALKRLQAETAAELDALLPAILNRAFKGEL
jgi:hypothetical protein